MKKILFIILMLFAINANAQFRLSQYPDSVTTLNDSSFFDISRHNGPGSFTSSKMRALRLPPFILKGWAFNPVDSAFYPIVSGKNIGTDTNRIDTVFMNSVFDYKNTSDLIFWNGTTRMIIKSDGKIGIGAINPVGLLAIKDDSTYIDRDAGKNLTFTDSVTGTKTLAELATGGEVSDSSFVVFQSDTNKAFNNTNIQTVDSSIFQEHLQTNKSFKVNGGLSLLKGEDATSSKFWLKGEDDVGTPLMYGRNDGNIGIGTGTPSHKLTLETTGVNDGFNLTRSTVLQIQLLTNAASGGHFGVLNSSGIAVINLNAIAGIDYIDTDNNLGIGLKTGISHKLTLETSATNDGFNLMRSGVDQIQLLTNVTSGGHFGVLNSSGVAVVNLNAISGVDFITTGNDLGVGLKTGISAKLHIKGVDTLITNFALTIEDSAGDPLFNVKNIGDVVINRTLNYWTDTSSVDDDYGIIESLITGYREGMSLYVNISVANTGAATLEINALGAITIKKLHDQDLITGDVEVGQIIHVIYDGTNFQMLSQLGQ